MPIVSQWCLILVKGAPFRATAAYARAVVRSIQESRTRERTRLAILRAGIAVLTRSPAASLGEVAAAAGVARSTLHRYYSDRTALVEGIHAFVHSEYRAVLGRARLDEGTGLEAYARLCSELVDSDEVFSWWLQEQPSGSWGATPEDAVVASVLERGRADGSIDPRLDPDWIALHTWAALYTARVYPLTGSRSPREARELCVRTLVKVAARKDG
jgi:TetR/AcrR family transcriptional regulator, repressor for lfrA